MQVVLKRTSMKPDSHKYRDSTLTVPNVLTAFRIVMALTAAALFAAGTAERQAVILCIISALLDAFDGWYARTFSQCSNLGKHLDPLADKLLMAVVFGLIAVRMSSTIVWILVSLIGLRELYMTLFRAYSLRRHRKFIPASNLGKVKMTAQCTVGLAIISYVYFWKGDFHVSGTLVVPPLVLILILSYVSAIAYLRAWYGARGAGVEAVQAGAEKKYSGSGRLVVGK
jgi:CDP-diacylglycerol--glycerol-3-phosphate 3-phosphatidyltransferase